MLQRRGIAWRFIRHKVVVLEDFKGDSGLDSGPPGDSRCRATHAPRLRAAVLRVVSPSSFVPKTTPCSLHRATYFASHNLFVSVVADGLFAVESLPLERTSPILPNPTLDRELRTPSAFAECNFVSHVDQSAQK